MVLQPNKLVCACQQMLEALRKDVRTGYFFKETDFHFSFDSSGHILIIYWSTCLNIKTIMCIHERKKFQYNTLWYFLLNNIHSICFGWLWNVLLHCIMDNIQRINIDNTVWLSCNTYSTPTVVGLHYNVNNWFQNILKWYWIGNNILQFIYILFITYKCYYAKKGRCRWWSQKQH